MDFANAIAPLTSNISNLQARVLVLEDQTKCHEEKAELREKLLRSEMTYQINQVSAVASQGLAQLGQTVANNSAAIAQITHLYVPGAQVTPTPMPMYNSWATPTTTAGEAKNSTTIGG